MGNNENRTKAPIGLQTKDQLISAVANVMFGSKVGAILPIYNQYSKPRNDSKISAAIIPGIWSLCLQPAVGSDNKGLNAIGTKLYAELIKNISGAKTVEKSDYMIYLHSGKGIVDAIRKFKTIYQIAFTYKTYNLYFADTMLQAYGLNPAGITELMANLADFRGWLNRFIRRANTLNLPNIPFLTSGWNYGKTILVDNPDIEHAQMYIFPINWIRVWDPTSDPNGTRGTNTAITGTLTAMKAAAEAALDALLLDDDAIDINAWVGKAYDGKLLTFTDQVEGVDDVIIAYDQDALSVVENADIQGDISVASDFNLTQVNNTISDKLVVRATPADASAPNIVAVSDKLLNYHKRTVGADAVTRGLSLCRSYKVTTSTSGGNTVYNCALDICPDYVVRESLVWMSPTAARSVTTPIYDGSIDAYRYQAYFYSNVFRYHPLIKYAAYTWDTQAGDYADINGAKSSFIPLWDFDNYSVISQDLVRQVVDAMWYIYFDIK